MNNTREKYLNYCNTIQLAINECQNLLKIFKKERTDFVNNTKGKIPLEEITKSLIEKNNILDSFFVQQKILKKIQKEDFINNDLKNNFHQKKLQELTNILEQLLIISNENEKIIRNEIQ